jgi:hypothetical protein
MLHAYSYFFKTYLIEPRWFMVIEISLKIFSLFTAGQIEIMYLFSFSSATLLKLLVVSFTTFLKTNTDYSNNFSAFSKSPLDL